MNYFPALWCGCQVCIGIIRRGPVSTSNKGHQEAGAFSPTPSPFPGQWILAPLGMKATAWEPERLCFPPIISPVPPWNSCGLSLVSPTGQRGNRKGDCISVFFLGHYIEEGKVHSWGIKMKSTPTSFMLSSLFHLESRAAFRGSQG